MSVKLSIAALKSLRRHDIRILVAVEHGMITREYVEPRFIARFTGLGEDYVLERLKALNKLGLVQRTKRPYLGYLLTSRGYDCLALNALIKQGVLESISPTPLGEGKESEVYAGLTPGGRKVAVKFHRVGRVSFRKTRRVRGYVAERRHISWIYEARLSASHEYEALEKLFRGGVSVPEPVGWNRHIVVTGYIEGVELFRVPPLTDPEGTMARVLEEAGKAYRLGVIHGDLSEYNVLVVGEGDTIVLFDWPQWIPSTHPQARRYLERDIRRIAGFFKRKYGLEIDPREVTEDFLRGIGLR